MKRYELGLAKGYISDWGIQDALREFVQNGIDQENMKEGNDFTVGYDADKGVLTLCNRSSVLNKGTLLLGCSSKRGDEDSIGTFGEGYKLAVLVLLRNGKDVVIENYGAREKWAFRFSKLKKYDYEESLVVDIDTAFPWAKVPDADLTVRITGIAQEEYEELRERTLFLREGGYEYKETSFGRILTEDGLAGKIFVNGLFVTDVEDLSFGYDIKPKHLKIGRDRNLVNDYIILATTKRMWLETGDRDMLLEMVNSGVKDLGQIHLSFDSPDLYFDSEYNDQRRELSDMLYGQAVEKYGKGVLIAEDEDGRDEAERKYPGRKVIVEQGYAGTLIRDYSPKYSSVLAEAMENEVSRDDMCMRDKILQWCSDIGRAGSDALDLLDLIEPMVSAYIKAGGDFYGDGAAA